MIGTQEIILILIAAFLLFGAKKIPDIARSIGVGIREFKKALTPDPDPGRDEDVHRIKEKNIKKYNAKTKKPAARKRK
ncbi:MAG: twin-arginine translocase TatA/TatE family subunit [bacterium]|nr:twin-arginine translocase TatA/TatE family subunit [bacterium]